MNFHTNHLTPSFIKYIVRNVYILEQREGLEDAGKNFVIENHHYFNAVPPSPPYTDNSAPPRSRDAPLEKTGRSKVNDIQHRYRKRR